MNNWRFFKVHEISQITPDNSETVGIYPVPISKGLMIKKCSHGEECLYVKFSLSM